MNRLQRKIKKLNESMNRLLMREAKQSDLVKRLQGLMTQYIAFLNGKSGNTVDKAEFKNKWFKSLHPGTEGYKLDNGTPVTTVEELRSYLMNIITLACNGFKTGALVLNVKGQQKELTSNDIYTIFLGDKNLGLQNSLLFALQQLQAQKLILQNEKLNFEQAFQLAQKNPLQFAPNMLSASV